MHGTWAVSGRVCTCAYVHKPTDTSSGVKMSSVKDLLLEGAPTDYSNYRTVSKETTVVSVEPAHKVGHDDTYDGPGSGSVSFHEVSYMVSSCFGRKRKLILDSVR